MNYPPHESIFSSTIRIFLKMFFGIFGILTAFIVFALIYNVISETPTVEENTTLTILNDADDKRESLPKTTPVILQIAIHGIIGDSKKGIDSCTMQNILNDSRTGDLAGNRVKGILLHFNTPGGTVVDSDGIYRMLNDYKTRYNIPVFGYVDGLCASGGMYIASAADQVYAGPSSIVGSVGVVIGPFFNVYETLGKIGMQAKTITAGLDKDMFNPTRPWKEEEGSSIQAVTSFMYERFVDIVTKARTRLDKEKLVGEYGARIYDCVTGQKLGYVDHAMSSRNEALKALLISAKVDPSTSYQVVSLTPKNQWISELLHSSKSPLLTGKIEHTIEGIPQEIREQPCYLYRYE